MFRTLINLRTTGHKLLRLLFHPPTQRGLLINLFLCRVLAHVLGDLHSSRSVSPHGDYVARDSLFAIALAISFFFAPAANSARIKRSSETAGSLASILATRDWLERRRFANSCCERP